MYWTIVCSYEWHSLRYSPGSVYRTGMKFTQCGYFLTHITQCNLNPSSNSGRETSRSAVVCLCYWNLLNKMSAAALPSRYFPCWCTSFRNTRYSAEQSAERDTVHLNTRVVTVSHRLSKLSRYHFFSYLAGPQSDSGSGAFHDKFMYNSWNLAKFVIFLSTMQLAASVV